MPVLAAGLAIGVAACGSRTTSNFDGGERKDGIADVTKSDTGRKDKGKPDVSIIDVTLPDVQKDVRVFDSTQLDLPIIDKNIPDMVVGDAITDKLVDVTFSDGSSSTYACMGTASVKQDCLTVGQTLKVSSNITVKLLSLTMVNSSVQANFGIYDNGKLIYNKAGNLILSDKSTIRLSLGGLYTGTVSDAGTTTWTCASVYSQICTPTLSKKDCEVFGSSPFYQVNLGKSISVPSGTIGLLALNGMTVTLEIKDKQGKPISKMPFNAGIYVPSLGLNLANFLTYDSVGSRYYLLTNNLTSNSLTFWMWPCKSITPSLDAGVKDAMPE